MSSKFHDTILSLAPKSDAKNLLILVVGSVQELLLRKIKLKYSNSNIFRIDFSKELATKSNEVKGVNCINADPLHAPINEKSIDIVFCIAMIEFMNDPLVFLIETRKLLKPTGKLIVTVSNRLAYYPAYALLRRIPAITRRRFSTSLICWLIPDNDPALNFQPVDHAYSSKEVLKWMQETGYDIRNYAGYDFFKNLRSAKIQKLFERFVPPTLAHSFFIIAVPS